MSGDSWARSKFNCISCTSLLSFIRVSQGFSKTFVFLSKSGVRFRKRHVLSLFSIVWVDSGNLINSTINEPNEILTVTVKSQMTELVVSLPYRSSHGIAIHCKSDIRVETIVLSVNFNIVPAIVLIDLVFIRHKSKLLVSIRVPDTKVVSVLYSDIVSLTPIVV